MYYHLLGPLKGLGRLVHELNSNTAMGLLFFKQEA